MELRQLKYFLAVADQRSFVSAADVLYISRQAISKSVAQLEAELDVELFMRDSNGAFLTPAGIAFYDRVRACVMELEQIKADMQHFSTQYHQKVRIAFSVGTASAYEERLHNFRGEQDNIELQYTEHPEDRCVQMLLDHQAELAVCSQDTRESVLTSKCISSSPMGLLLSRTDPLCKKGAISEAKLRTMTLACVAGSPAEVYCKKHNLQPTYTGYDYLRLVRLATQGRCALFLPVDQAQEFRDTMSWVPLDSLETWDVYLIYPKLMENNVIHRTLLDEIQLSVFSMEPQSAKETGLTQLALLAQAVEKGKSALAREQMKRLLQAGYAPRTLIDQGIMAGLQAVGEKFAHEESFIPDMLVAARAAKLCTEVLQARTGENFYSSRKKVLIGTVRTDLHDIGKNMVATAIRSVGVEVIDLGVDVAIERFVQTVEADEDIVFVAVSALLTTTMPAMQATVKALNASPARDRFKILVGGAPITQEFADLIGADIFTDNAFAAAEAVKKQLIAGGEWS